MRTDRSARYTFALRPGSLSMKPLSVAQDSMLTGRQIREARHMLGWDRNVLGVHARVAEDVIQNAELAGSEPDIALFYMSRIQIALEQAGIRFGRNGAVLMSIARSVTGD